MSTNLQELEETVQAMMETSENLIQEGKWQKRAKICKACGKEGPSTNIKQHIEANHLEGLSLPCNLCDKIFRSRKVLGNHVKRKEKIVERQFHLHSYVQTQLYPNCICYNW